MSTHAARTEDDARVAGPVPEPRPMDPVERAEYLAREAFWRAAEVKERDHRDRCSHQGLPLYGEPRGPMLSVHARDYDFFNRIGQLAEWARDELMKRRDAGRARQRNTRR